MLDVWGKGGREERGAVSRRRGEGVDEEGGRREEGDDEP